ncbi:MAG: hypothetical protein Q7J98_08540 [Kiritimatiellia bacterium]|nr:hypothetical protein [Kiritimatiellia bacterium]
MKRMTMIAGLTAIVIAAGTGCTTVVKYDLKDARMARPDSKRQGMRVAVAPLQDMRPEQEKNPPVGMPPKCEIRDKMFKDGDVARGISEALVAHFNHVQLFKTAEMVDKSAMLTSSDVIEKMKGRNSHYDHRWSITERLAGDAGDASTKRCFSRVVANRDYRVDRREPVLFAFGQRQAASYWAISSVK